MKLRAKFESHDTAMVPTEAARPSPAPQPAAPDATVSAAARNLALAHRLDRLIDRGLIADFTAAARMLRVSQPRLTHLMSLMLLAPDIQAAILLGEMEFGDKALRSMARIAEWSGQVAAVEKQSRRR